MDKNTYETYEFLPANSSEAETDQFLVVQDDGTFLLNRQIQYVAQVQDVKEVLDDVQPCTVYGVSSQQFFVDVDNSAELISVSDQFILPDGDNSLYTNSYLLQPSSSSTTEQMDEDVAVDEYKPAITQNVDIDVVSHDSKQGNNFTEITLSDEQYQTLEQKGWILLESNDKIFVLNTLGLHDITTNDKLIQKLKNEIQNGHNSAVNNEGTLKIESYSSQFPNIVTEPLSNQQETVEFVISADSETKDTIDSVQYAVDNKENIQATSVVSEISENATVKHAPPKELMTETSGRLKQAIQFNEDTSSIKIKTKFNFKDIPENIFLGKTANGKRLIAKVLKNPPIEEKGSKYTISEEEPVVEQIAENQQYYATGLHEADFINLIQTTLRAGAKDIKEEDIVSADTVVSQLLKVPNLKKSMVGHNLIITKSTSNKDEFGTVYNKSKVTLVTGCVKETDEICSFEHIPDLLQTIKIKAEQNITQADEAFSCIEEKDAKEKFTIFHIHIIETKCVDNVIRVSVTLNKRQLPSNLVFDLKKRYPDTVFGCSSCAALFKSEEALKEHQGSQCMDTDDLLTIDSDHSNNDDDIIIMKTGKETVFTCAQCNIKFTKLCNIQRHMKTHQGTSQQILQTDRIINQDNEPKKKPSKVFKCKMCPSTYFHSATLSKHIVTRHIKVKSNKNVV